MSEQLYKALHDASMALMTPEMRQLWNEKQALIAKVARLEGDNIAALSRLGTEAIISALKIEKLNKECERLRADDRELRIALAFAYSGIRHLYGDDGELQDSRYPMIDYIRDTVADIRRKIQERGLAQLTKEQP